MNTLRKTVATVLLSLAFFAAGAVSAGATTPTPSPPSGGDDRVILYSGTATVEDLVAHVAGIYPLYGYVTFDCTKSPCTMHAVLTKTKDAFPGSADSVTIGGLNPHEVDGPSGSFFDAATGGDVCADTSIGAGELSYTATATSLTLTRDAPAIARTPCADGSTVESNPYRITAVGTLTSGNPCFLIGNCPTPTPAPTARPTNGSSTPHFSTPSTLSTLPTLATALSLTNLIWAGAMSVVLVLLVSFPTHLLNSATDHGSERFSNWWQKFRQSNSAKTRVPKSTDATRPVQLAGWPLAAAGVAAASLISSFVSPTFGFNPGSVRVFVSILVSFVLDTVAGWFIVIWLVRRASPNLRASFTFAPASLLIVIAAVIFSRTTGFQPGIVFGLVAGVAFGSALAVAEKAKTSLIALGYSFGLAIVAWAGYSLIDLTAGSQLGGALLFVRETLSSVAIAGIAAVPIVLVPVRGLTGFEIYTWNRVVWAAGYAIGLFGFFVVLMPKPFSWASVPLNIWVWVAIFVAYAVFAVGVWLLVVRPWRRGSETELVGATERGE